MLTMSLLIGGLYILQLIEIWGEKHKKKQDKFKK
jgi:hypothetical protein